MSDDVEVKTKDLFSMLINKIKHFDRELSNLKEMVKTWEKIDKELETFKTTLSNLKLDQEDDDRRGVRRDETLDKLVAHINNLNIWKEKMDEMDIKDLIKTINTQKKEISILRKNMKDFSNDKPVKAQGSLISTSSIGTIAGIAGSIIMDYLSKKAGG